MTDSSVKISVIMLTYNHEPHIRQAIESVIMQKTDFDFEVLVGDDASTDGTPGIITEYASKRPGLIRKFIRPQNIGATRNFTDLLRRACGQYIIGCEGDDYWTDASKLQKQAAYMDAHPECSGCTHPIEVVREDGSKAKDQKLKWICNKPVYTLKDFKGIFLPGHPASLLHRNSFSEKHLSLIESAHKHIGDRTIAMLLASSGDIHRIGGKMACYRKVCKQGGNNATSMLYVGKEDAKLADFRMTLALENYARGTLKAKVSFGWFKRNLIMRALGKAMLKPSKETFACLAAIIKEWR